MNNKYKIDWQKFTQDMHYNKDTGEFRRIRPIGKDGIAVWIARGKCNYFSSQSFFLISVIFHHSIAFYC